MLRPRRRGTAPFTADVENNTFSRPPRYRDCGGEIAFRVKFHTDRFRHSCFFDAGLYYPMIIAAITVIIGSIFLKETRGHKIWAEVEKE